MKSIVTELSETFRTAIKEVYGVETDPMISRTQSKQFGDYQANVAMSLAKDLSAKSGQKVAPRTVAEKIKAAIPTGDMLSEVSIAGPGFLNVRFSPAWLAARLVSICADSRLGIESVAEPVTTVIDYSSPNVAKQMHVGHLRPTNIGDALSRVVEFVGYPVIRQNHVGDWGTQFGMLLRFLKETESGAQSHISDLEGFYRSAKKRFDEDAAFAEESRQMVVRLQSGDPEALALWQRIVEESRRSFEAVYQQMDIKLTRADERGESFYNPFLGDVVRELKDLGIAVEDDGAIVTWCKGFEAPLIIQKRGGGFGYGTTDLAALRFRIRDLGGKRLIYVTDARQAQHFSQFFDAARRAGWVNEVALSHVMFGMILGEDNKPLKTRSGESVKLMDLLEEAKERALKMVTQKLSERGLSLSQAETLAIAHAVGIGAIKYFDLNRDPVGNYVFSWEKMLALDGNTAPYLQYAYARIQSIFRKAETVGRPYEKGGIVLETPWELDLAKHILGLSDVVSIVARELKPHYLCNYLYDLATLFSAFYENCSVLQSEGALCQSRLSLCDLTGRTMALGLDLLGIEHPSQM